MVTVRKMNQEGRIYYYLEHPVKVNGKVKKHSKYLGKELPANIEEVKEQFLLEIDRSRWYALSKRAKEKLEAIRKNLSSGDLDQFYHDNALSLTANSLRISGSSVTFLELKRLIENSTVPNWRNRDEIMEAKAHYSIVRTIYCEKPQFSIGLLVDWHWKLFRESRPSVAGVVKETLFNTLNEGYTGETEGNYSDASGSSYLENAKNIDGAMLAGLVHLKLCRDTPFHEGNGVIARLAMNLILQTFGLPMLNIEFNERKRYEDAIRKSILQNKETVFLKWYFLNYSRKIVVL